MSKTSSVLPENNTVEQVFKTLETETTALFEHLNFSFLMDCSVFAPDSRGRTRVHQPPELLKGVLHCFYHDIYDCGQWSEYSGMKMFGDSVASSAHCHGGRSRGSSPTSLSLQRMFSSTYFLSEAGSYVHPNEYSPASTPLIYRPIPTLSSDSIEPRGDKIKERLNPYGLIISRL